MKFIFSLFGVVLAVVSVFCLTQRSEDVVVNADYVRIHIVANSSDSADVEAQHLVKDAVVEFLIPLLSEAETSEDALEIVEGNLNKIDEVAKRALGLLGLEKEVKTSVEEEFVPTRSYEKLTLAQGTYTTLRIELGKAQGDNWWCVVFPAVCFLDTSNPDNFEYVSKIWQIIESVLGKS